MRQMRRDRKEKSGHQGLGVGGLGTEFQFAKLGKFWRRMEVRVAP